MCTFQMVRAITKYGFSLLLTWFPSVYLVLYVAAANAQDLKVVNGNFQQSAIGNLVPGWRLEQHAGEPAYEIDAVSDDIEPSNTVVRIRRTRDEMYGLIGQEVPLASFSKGDEIELSARMRTKEVGPQGWVLAIDMLGRVHRLLPVAILKQARSRPVTGNSEWQTISVRSAIPEGTTSVGISALLLDNGTAWIDDVRVRIAR